MVAFFLLKTKDLILNQIFDFCTKLIPDSFNHCPFTRVSLGLLFLFTVFLLAVFETCGLALWSTRLLSPPLVEPLVPPPRPLARPLPPSRWPFGGDNCLLLFSPFSWILALLTLVLPFSLPKSFWSPWLPASLFVTLLLADGGGFAYPLRLDLFSPSCRELLPRRESLTASFLLSFWWYWLLPRLPRRPVGWTFAGFEWRLVEPGMCPPRPDPPSWYDCGG